MNEWIEITAKTVDEALTEAALQLGTSSDNMEYEVIDHESNGFLGKSVFLLFVQKKVRFSTKL